MKITFYSARSWDERFFNEALDSASTNRIEPIYQRAALDHHTTALSRGSEAVCVFVDDTLDQTTLEGLAEAGVKAILLRCAGVNNLDLECAERLGFFVAHVPAYSPEAVAEHALALTQTLNRRTHRAFNRVREGNLDLDGLLGVTLHGKTAGIVGTGRIGLATARIFQGLGCRVLGYDPTPSEAFDRLGERVSLDTLLAQSDVISLHCPLTDDTHHLLDERAFSRMKESAMVINTSRGALIDTRAAIEALKARRLGALGIDVYEQESGLFFRDHSDDIIDDDLFSRLVTLPNVLVTGHQGFFTVEALEAIARVTLENLDCYQNDTPCDNALAGRA